MGEGRKGMASSTVLCKNEKEDAFRVVLLRETGRSVRKMGRSYELPSSIRVWRRALWQGRVAIVNGSPSVFARFELSLRNRPRE